MAHKGARRLVIVCVTCVGLLGLLGCGGSKSTASSTSDASARARAAWASRTQQLCVEKRATIAKLGSVEITYGGIARLGLPAVKGDLDRYLARLLGVLRVFEQRQRQVATPPSLVAATSIATELDRQSQSATSRLRRAVASSRTAAELSAAFHAWIATSQPLAARGDALAQQLNLPSCRSPVAAASS